MAISKRPESAESGGPCATPGRWTKLLLVSGGYAAAVVIAAVAVAARVLLQPDEDGSASGGMAAFGDALFFLGVFGIAAVPATVAALVFLRARPLFWQIASLLALAGSVTGVAALYALLTSHSASHSVAAPPGTWSLLAPLRLLLAPLFALATLLAALLSPLRRCRHVLLACAAAEAVVLVWALLFWLGAAP